MSVFGMSLRHQKLEQGFVRLGQWKVELGLLLGWTLLALWNQNQASDSFFFTVDSLIEISPYFLVSIRTGGILEGHWCGQPDRKGFQW